MRHNNFFSAAIILVMIAFLTISGKPSKVVGPPGAVTIMISGVPEGTFIASGALETSGTNTMVIHPSGKSHAGAIHCTNTLVTAQGSFTLLMNCQFSTSTGTWRIVSDTGSYSNLRGTGSLIMTMSGDVFVETLTGRIF